MKFHDFHPPKDDFKKDVLHYLSQTQKQLLSKYFYDETGSKIFDEITRMPSYYPTKTEVGILSDQSEFIGELLPSEAVIIEFGSGSSVKIKKILDECPKIKGYIPIDISKEHLKASAQQLEELYPKLRIEAVCGDYTKISSLPMALASEKKIIFFPGSSIGNQDNGRDVLLLKNARSLLDQGEGMILGADLVKDLDILLKAYDDPEGVTARFNKNILERMNRELGGDFDLEQFAHEVRFNETYSRVEMHLKSLVDQEVRVAGASFFFKKGETIHTESSHKYTRSRIEKMASEAGFVMEQFFTDDRAYFSVSLFRAV